MILVLLTMQMITLLLYWVIHLITSLENVAKKLFEWFTNNHMKANHDKCHQLVSTFTPISIKVKDYMIKNSDYEKLLGITVDANLNFNCHSENKPKKASKKFTC